MRPLILSLTLLFLACSATHAQQDDWQYYYEQLLDEMQDDSEEQEAEELAETLSSIAAEPININAATREDLEELLFLTNSQIDAVLEYVRRYGPLITDANLMMIPALDDTRRGLLRCLTYLGEMPPREHTVLDTLRYEAAKKKSLSYRRPDESRGEVTAFASVPFYTRQGYKNGNYAGEKYKHWLRANYKVSNQLRVGLLASQDAGEPFFKGENRWGYDFYSAYVQLKNTGKLRNLVVGHYRIKTGLGLILNSNLSFGKTLAMTSAQSQQTVIRPHNSRSEGNYLQGAALTVALSRAVDATLFASYRKIDATLQDSTGIRTILTSGYHRTESELSRKHNASQSAAGINLRATIDRFNIGLTALVNHYSMPLTPYQQGSSSSQLYRMYYAAGQDFWNVSINYGYRVGRLLRIEGETATGDCGQLATVNSLSWRCSRGLTLSSILRYYPYRFYSTMGRSFSEGGYTQNESGLYVGATWTPTSRLTLSAYTDFAYFPWPKYQALGASHSFDNLVQLSYQLSPSSSLSVRYRLKMREKDGDTDGELIYKNEHRLRVSFTSERGRLTLRSQADASYCDYKTQSAGLMLFQTARYRARTWTCSVGAGWFSTKDYNSRIYIYEQSTPYNFGSRSFYGDGMRLYTLLSINLPVRLTLTGKLGLTHYFDRDEIGSSYQTINSSTQTDLDIMLRWRL